jgi:ubiquinone biosynthesis protein COQ9
MSSEKDRFLDALLPLVPFDGWSIKAMEEAEKKVQLNEQKHYMLFPGGAAEVIRYFIERSNIRMLESLKNYNLESMKIRERIATIVMVRLHNEESNKEAIRRAIGQFSLPHNASHSLAALYSTVDEMWRTAGDTATDFNFYTKRLLLAKVYTSTLLFWLDDTSNNHEETEAFLRRRIDDVMQIQKFKAKCSSFLNSLSDTSFAKAFAKK